MQAEDERPRDDADDQDVHHGIMAKASEFEETEIGLFQHLCSITDADGCISRNFTKSTTYTAQNLGCLEVELLESSAGADVLDICCTCGNDILEDSTSFTRFENQMMSRREYNAYMGALNIHVM
jgi:hypothetical protein